MLKTPFLPNFPRTLFGRAKARAADLLASQKAGLMGKSLLELGALLGRFLPQEKLFAKPAEGPGSRECIYTPQITFWAFLHQVLTRNMPCRDAVRKIQALHAERGKELPDSDSSAYCQARGRLDNDVLLEAHCHLANWLEGHAGEDQLWCGRDVKVFDGTGVSMPDTEANQARWPQNASQKPGCGFPSAQLVGCFSLAHCGLLAWSLSDQSHHESMVWRDMWDLLEPRDVVLTDRGFCSYESIARLKDREIDSVMRLHQRRKPDFRRGKRLGDGDRMQVWDRPQRPKDHPMSKEEWEQLPEKLEVRLVRMRVQAPGFRTTEIVLVTSLLDAEQYPAEALCELHLKRWRVELYFRDIKTTLGMDVLRCKSPAMVEKEISMHAIAYNAIRAIMQEAAATHHVALDRLSFKGSVDTVREWSGVFSHRKSARELRRLHGAMLGVIASDPVPERPGRSEPRAKKRRPKTYQLMTAPRGEMVVSKSRKWSQKPADAKS
jgi:hypothetical protein